MTLKAVLFDFNGVIINDEQIHLQLIDEILIQENLQPQRVDERQTSLGRSDRACFTQLLSNRGRVVTEKYLTQLLHRKAEAYTLELEKIEKLPLYPGVEDLIYQVRSRNLKLGLVSGAIRKEIDLVLHQAKLNEYFKIIVAGDDITASKPEPDGYLLAVKKLNEEYPQLNLQPQECLAIEDTPAGIQAAKRSHMQVVGVANTYPFHMLQRCCNWTVDYLTDLELQRVQEVYSQKQSQPSVSE
ncbi:MAG: HAD family hydrolase [Nostoc sp. ZfuVER08]|jgi:phosphoglycolate phosphatase/beta-phosphoglucomutase|uniref:HAD family phosphatase n=1 Tax=Nostoc punctiforme FACHB-252 TaxID=1357509 RepID=A0ABR8H557_NOSPU|nr:HAD family phosphatase [Nostoc punctiforme]MBD2610422.1 HAD family phosphatase [Nostoc punctiforme FACHB-252]MBL1200962.1 HAD family phosphatase [Nostoc sp. GBBB01]MDZ8011281.1 HAD family phosphatase [Nostoc sp. ZfuVER08]